MTPIGPGTRLGHYEIIAPLGSGGMGQVYAARDERLQRDVALKVLSDSDAEEDGLLTEARAASRLHHPNICVVHEVGNANGVPYLVMELIDGGRLADRAAHQRNPSEAIRIGIQVASALEHAHKYGVLHRDLKPANVLVTPEGVAKVVDFGLARRTRGAVGDDIATAKLGDGTIVGTVPYMAPEVILGKPVDVRTDLWALGVLLYEISSGRLPFEGSNSFAITAAILHEPPARLGTDVPPSLRAVIERLLDKEPLRRYQTAGEVKAALEAIDLAPTHAVTRSRRSPRTVAAIALVAIAVLAGMSYLLLRYRTPAPAALVEPAGRSAIAVFGFRNATGADSNGWIETALIEMVSEALGATSDVRLIEGEGIADARREGMWSNDAGLARDRVRDAAGRLDADFLVAGRYEVATAQGNGETLTVTTSLFDRDGTLRDEKTATGSINAVDEIARQLTSELASLLPAKRARTSPAASDALPADVSRTQFPQTPGATRWYSDGVAKLHAGNAVAARESLERAVAEDASSAIVHMALSDAWAALGYSARARDELEAAIRQRATLSWDEQQAAQARLHELANDWGAAADVHRRLWTLYPDVADHAIRLALAKRRQGQPAEALGIMRQLHESAAFIRDPRIDLAEAEAHLAIGDAAALQQAAARAVEKAQRIGAVTLLARARRFEGLAQSRLGALDAADAAFAESLRLHRAAKDARGVAETMVSRGIMTARFRGDLAAARQIFVLSADVFRDIGDRERLANTFLNLANTYYLESNWLEARKYYEQALTLADEIRDERLAASVLNNLGAVSYASTNLRDAERYYLRARALLQRVGDRATEAVVVGNLGDIRVDAGQYAEGRRLLEEALALGDRSSREALADVLRMTGAAGEAEQLLRADLADPAATAQARQSSTAALVRLLARSGRSDEARDLAKASGDAATLNAAPPGVKSALARALGDSADARRSRQELLALLARSGLSDRERFVVAIDLAALERAGGDGRGADARLREIERDARAKGLVRYVDLARAERGNGR